MTQMLCMAGPDIGRGDLAEHVVELAALDEHLLDRNRFLAQKGGYVGGDGRAVARHGAELAHLAEKHGATLNFEAAVAGGIPVVKALLERPVRNGTTGDGRLAAVEQSVEWLADRSDAVEKKLRRLTLLVAAGLILSIVTFVIALSR